MSSTSDAQRAGYSRTPLPRKLGIRPGQRGYVHVASDARDLVDLDAWGLGEWQPMRRLADGFDLAVVFSRRGAQLEDRLDRVTHRLAVDGALWACWPKQASGVATDLDGNRVRSLGLATGLVDVKVAAVSDVWSGLKFVRRLSDR